MSFKRFLMELEQHGIKIEQHQLRYLIRTARITRPVRDVNGDFQWSAEQIHQLAALLADPSWDRRRRKQKEISAVA